MPKTENFIESQYCVSIDGYSCETENFSEKWYCVGIDGHLWVLMWNWKFQFFCQKWFQIENFSESCYSVWVPMGINGYSCETEIFNFSARYDFKLKISVKVGTVWVLMGINGYSCETENFHFSARNDFKLKISVKVGTLCGYQWVLMWSWKFPFFCQNCLQTKKNSVTVGTVWVLMGIYGNLSEIENFNFSARNYSKLKISVKNGTLCGYQWVLMWNWKWQVFCQKWFQTENFSESWYSVKESMGINGYSCGTENFNFSARNDSKLKIFSLESFWEPQNRNGKRKSRPIGHSLLAFRNWFV